MKSPCTRFDYNSNEGKPPLCLAIYIFLPSFINCFFCHTLLSVKLFLENES